MEQLNQQPNPVIEQQQSWPEGAARPRMSMGEAVKACISKYATFGGRSRRSEYWWFSLFLLIISIVLLAPIGVCVALIDSGTINPDAGAWSVVVVIAGILALLSGLFLLFSIIPSISVQVRRLHDVGRSGWWVFWMFAISLVAAVVPLFVLGFDKAVDMNDFSIISNSFSASLVSGLIVLVANIANWAMGIAVFIFSLFDSQRGANKYGPSPKYQ